MRHLLIIGVAVIASCGASMDDLPDADQYRARPVERVQDRRAPAKPPKQQPTKWKIRVEGMKDEFFIPIPIAKEFNLKPGQTISIETARLIAEEIGAEYPPAIRDKLERLDKRP